MYYPRLKDLREDADLVVCGYDYFDEEGNVDTKRLYKTRENEKLTQKDVMHRFSDMPPSIRHGVVNKLFRKGLLQEIRFAEGLHSSEDVLFLSEYVLKIKSAIMIHQPFYKNTVRQGSATHGGLNIESLADSFRAHDKMYSDIVRQYPELKNHSLAFLLDVCTLKYYEARNKIDSIESSNKKQINNRMKEMRSYIKKKALEAIFNKEVYWKNRIMYLIMR